MFSCGGGLGEYLESLSENGVIEDIMDLSNFMKQTKLLYQEVL